MRLTFAVIRILSAVVVSAEKQKVGDDDDAHDTAAYVIDRGTRPAVDLLFWRVNCVILLLLTQELFELRNASDTRDLIAATHFLKRRTVQILLQRLHPPGTQRLVLQSQQIVRRLRPVDCLLLLGDQLPLCGFYSRWNILRVFLYELRNARLVF